VATRDLIVIGASAGGVEALTYLAGQLPADLPAAVLVVVHVANTSPGLLPRILSRAGPLRALPAVDGAPIVPGYIHVAPPGRHMVVHGGTVRLAAWPRVNHPRPAIDLLFRSARACGPRVVGVVLTGYLDDRTAGLTAIKRAGGVAVVQDPADALIDHMPASALRHVDVDHVVALPEIAPLLARLARRLAVRLGARGSEHASAKFAEQAAETERHANLVRGSIEGQVTAAAGLADEGA